MRRASIHYELDVTAGAAQVVRCAMRIKAQFTSRRVDLAFPRWSPGSYLIREPFRLVHDLTATANIPSGETRLNPQRHGPSEVRLTIPDATKSVTIEWSQYANDLSVRTNHLDSTHFHLMPSATWPVITTGVVDFSECKLLVSMLHPADWSATSQMPNYSGKINPILKPSQLTSSTESTHSKGVNEGFTNERVENDVARTTWQPIDRDALYDGVIEANPNPEIIFPAGGRTFRLKYWDAAGLPIRQEDMQRLIKAMTQIIDEAHALFGKPPWDDYAIILHLTGKLRGGLEHTGSQTSAVKRTAMDEGDEVGWRDLVSLLSHEYVHAWNVKRLRPKEFLSYDLTKECHTDLLWWFEGVTSWLGDLICVRSGAWSTKDWIDDLEHKMSRHVSMSGNLHQSLAESSHESWIHLYRPHCFSNQTTISYYLQGELAAMCLDLGIRRRTKGKRGLEDVMIDLWKRHGGLIIGDDATAPGAPNSDAIPGIVHDDIRRSMNLVSNGRMGAELNRLVKQPVLPPIDEWAKAMGHSFTPKSKPKPGDSVLGIKISSKGGQIVVAGFLPNSPARERLQVGDELISIDGRRIRDNLELKSSLRGKVDQEVALLLNRRGGIIASSVIPIQPPELGVRLTGKGNALWRSMLLSRRHISDDSE